jgi:hypothetical protein
MNGYSNIIRKQIKHNNIPNKTELQLESKNNNYCYNIKLLLLKQKSMNYEVK